MMSVTNDDRIKPMLNITGGGEESDLVVGLPNIAAIRCSLKSCRGIKFSLLLSPVPP